MYWGSMLTGGIESIFCAGDAGNATLGCADSPGNAVVLVGGATSFVIFSCPRGTVVAVSGAISGANPGEPGVC